MEEIASPCTKICALDPQSGLCIGCLRTLDEITGWPDYTAQQKHAVLAQVAVRGMRVPGTGAMPPPAFPPDGA